MKAIIFSALALFTAIAYAASTQQDGSLIIAPTGVGAGSYGSASKSLAITVNSTGRLSAAAAQDIAIAGSQVTSGTVPAAVSIAGTLTSAAVVPVATLLGSVAAAKGGTGLGVQAKGVILQSNGTNWVAVGPCGDNQVLVSSGSLWACGAN